MMKYPNNLYAKDDTLNSWMSGSECPHDLEKKIMQRYPVLIDGILHRGTKMVLGGGSKSYKTWTLLNLAASVASGTPWFGHDTVDTGLDVIYLNFEVPELFFWTRVRSVCNAMGLEEIPDNLVIWSLRGQTDCLQTVLMAMKDRMTNGCALLVIDPIYKALGGRNENSAGDIGQLMNEVEAIAEQTGAAVAFGAHYSKGNQAEKDPLDRISGSGVFARDPDTIMGLTAHEEENCYTVDTILRNFPNIDPYVIEWEFPLFKRKNELDARRLKRYGQKLSDGMILKVLETNSEGLTSVQIAEKLLTKSCEASEGTIRNRISSLKRQGKIKAGGNKRYFINY